MDKNQRNFFKKQKLQKQRQDLCTKTKKVLSRERERERQKSGILGKHKKSVGFYAATRS
jgi:hypothetical protein